MKLVATKRTDYGIRALLYLAGRPERRVKAAEIAQAMNIPQGFLHQVLQELQRARLVDSRPSRHGGYRLSRPPTEVSLLEVVEALEGPLRAAECALRGGACRDDVCVLHGVWSGAHDALRRELGSTTLDGLVDRGAERGLTGMAKPATPNASAPPPLHAAVLGVDGGLDTDDARRRIPATRPGGGRI